MYLPFVTSSGVDRFLACTGSALLPRVYDDNSAAAVAGTAEHAVRLQKGRLPRKVVDWFGDEPAYEVAMATDIEGTESLYVGQYLERGYPPMPGPRWLCGTADMIRIDGDVVSLGDLKTGRGQARGALPEPDKSGQLLSLAWLAIRLRQQKEARRLHSERPAPGFAWQPARIRLMWWLTADAIDDIDDAEITYQQLLDWVASFRRRVMLTQKQGALQLRRGPHCGNCVCFDACPAQGGAVRRILELSGRLGGDASLSDGDVSAAYQDLQAVKKIVERADAAIKLRVESRGEVAVDDGHKLKLIRGTDSKIDVAVAAEVLGEHFFRCASVSVSQEGLRRGLETQDISGVMEELRKRGGVFSAPKAPYLRVVKAK